MTFDIHGLDKIDGYSEEGEEALYEYQDALIELFHESPEGAKHRKTYPQMGFWAQQLIYYGHGYIGVTIPQMSVANVEEILLELFPRKISLSSPDEALDTIPELIAFWEYLKREYKLRKANAILGYLKGIRPEKFVNIINDPSRFGMAKSFFSAGQSAGFDMTNEEEMKTFTNLYNASLLEKTQRMLEEPSKSSNQVKIDRAKEKRKRKASKAARKRNRRKK